MVSEPNKPFFPLSPSFLSRLLFVRQLIQGPQSALCCLVCNNELPSNKAGGEEINISTLKLTTKWWNFPLRILFIYINTFNKDVNMEMDSLPKWKLNCLVVGAFYVTLNLTHTHIHTHSLFVPSMQSGGKASYSHRAREACSSEGQTLTLPPSLSLLSTLLSACSVPPNLATSTENRERGDL